MAVIDSIDQIYASIAANEPLNRLWTGGSTGVAPTAGNSTSGYSQNLRHPSVWTMPSVGGGLTGMYATACNIWCPGGAYTAILALEYLLGTLTVSGNVFSSTGAVSMPTKPVKGSSIVTSSMLTFAVVTTALTATTPVLTTTYTDQDGNGSQSCVMTLPTNPVTNSAYRMQPHLAAGDTGVRAVSNISISTGSAGVIKIYGLLPIQEFSIDTTVNRHSNLQPLKQSRPQWLIEPAETLAMYFGEIATANNQHMVQLTGVAAS